MGKRIIAVEDILEAAKTGNKSLATALDECIVTPGARDKAAELGILLVEGAGDEAASRAVSVVPDASQAEQVVREVCTLIKARLPSGLEAESLEGVVRDVVSARLEKLSSATAPLELGSDMTCVDGVCFIRGSRLLEGGAGPVPVSEKALVAEAIRCGEDYKLSGGFMEWEKATFSRTVEFPEIGIVLEGELRLTVGGKTLTAAPGDMVYFPKGAQIVYSASAKVRIACVNCIR